MSDARSSAPPLRTPLHERHAALGASFTDFGGWLMPLRYGSELAEHHAVRAAAGLFDVSHMAEFLVHGDRAADFLGYALVGGISMHRVGRAAYALALAEDGGIVDDVIVYRTGPERFVVVANAGNREAVASALAAARARWSHVAAFAESPATDRTFAVAGHGAPVVEDITDHTALLALQGPRAAEILAGVVELTLETPIADIGAYTCAPAQFEDEGALVARTGYTGEDGFEILVPSRNAAALWDALIEAGAPAGLVPAGLAARDTLRLEAGMPLYGHELSRTIRPAQVGLARLIAASTPGFVGSAGVEPVPGAPVLVGLAAAGRRAGRAGYPVTAAEGTVVGEITSGALSPTLGHPIAMALIDPRHAAPGTALTIDIRGSSIPATVTPLPFYRRNR